MQHHLDREYNAIGHVVPSCVHMGAVNVVDVANSACIHMYNCRGTTTRGRKRTMKRKQSTLRDLHQTT